MLESGSDIEMLHHGRSPNAGSLKWFNVELCLNMLGKQLRNFMVDHHLLY